MIVLIQRNRFERMIKIRLNNKFDLNEILIDRDLDQEFILNSRIIDIFKPLVEELLIPLNMKTNFRICKKKKKTSNNYFSFSKEKLKYFQMTVSSCSRRRNFQNWISYLAALDFNVLVMPFISERLTGPFLFSVTF